VIITPLDQFTWGNQVIEKAPKIFNSIERNNFFGVQSFCSRPFAVWGALYHIVQAEFSGCFISKFFGSGVRMVSPVLVVPLEPLREESVSFVLFLDSEFRE